MPIKLWIKVSSKIRKLELDSSAYKGLIIDDYLDFVDVHGQKQDILVAQCQFLKKLFHGYWRHAPRSCKVHYNLQFYFVFPLQRFTPFLNDLIHILFFDIDQFLENKKSIVFILVWPKLFESEIWYLQDNLDS